MIAAEAGRKEASPMDTTCIFKRIEKKYLLAFCLVTCCFALSAP